MRSVSQRRLLLLLFSVPTLLCVVTQVHFIRNVALYTTGFSSESPRVDQLLTTATSADACLFSDDNRVVVDPACVRRREELAAKLSLERKLKNEMMRDARQRSVDDVYRIGDDKFHLQRHQLYLNKVKKAVFPLEPSLRPLKEWPYQAFADLSIIGFPKAGTSQLFRILTTHPHGTPIFKRKEFCVDHGHFLDYTNQAMKRVNNDTLWDLKLKLWRYRRHSYKKRMAAKAQNASSVNACLQPDEMEYHAAYTPLPAESRFFLIFRDPADWLWASWNFWVDENVDLARPLDHDWADGSVHYRSPELFHEIILSQQKMKPSGLRFKYMREQTVSVGRRLIHLVGRSRILFLKNENLQPASVIATGTLRAIADFSGLNETLFNSTVLSTRTNCNSHKGYQASCNTSGGSTAYEIAGGRMMLHATRELIYIQFHEECKVWAEEFGVVYQACLDAVQ